ncbi:SDR family oxidoreductase [Bdellovibrio sp. HCB117]|uniref:SDR family oxidoreductase n=1 Tax=Bdellovibrio sp. HCB117 TaxID=3394359 RepID=UPI0039B53902
MKFKDFKPKPLKQQTIVITGATSGIGLATAEMAAKRGARVALSSRNTDDLEKICRRLQEQGCNVIGVKADVRRIEELKELCEQTKMAFGNIDTWINNAGGSIYGPLLEIPEREERELFEMNFWGVRHGCHVAVEALKEKGGVLINLGSEVSLRSIPLQGMYSASKHAVKAYTDALRMELEHDEIPIQVCLVRPTAIDTPFPDHAINHLKSGEPSLPDPVYHPDYAAEAILRCCEKPERDVWVGAPSKMRAIMEFLAPELTDKMMEKSAFKDQSKGTDVPHSAENEGLFAAPVQEGEIQGHHKKKVKATDEMKKPHVSDPRPSHH